jgi:hypothetical protein
MGFLEEQVASVRDRFSLRRRPPEPTIGEPTRRDFVKGFGLAIAVFGLSRSVGPRATEIPARFTIMDQDGTVLVAIKTELIKHLDGFFTGHAVSAPVIRSGQATVVRSEIASVPPFLTPVVTFPHHGGCFVNNTYFLEGRIFHLQSITVVDGRS